VRRALAGGVLFGLFANGTATTQDLGAARQRLREDLSSANFAQSLLGLVLLSDELELSGASYTIDDGNSTDLETYALPFHVSRPLRSDHGLRWHLEGTLGYAEARQGSADVYGGQLPGLETAVDTRWRAYGALAGLGLEVPLADDLTLAAIVDLGVSRLENDARFTGPGAAVTAAFTDGIAFNWDALALTHGGALRSGWRRQLGAGYRLELAGRYDIRWTDTVQEDDAAQDFVARSQLMTLRADLFGPTGWTLFERDLGWQLTGAYRHFPEGDLFGVQGYAQLGASLLVPTGDLGVFGANGFALGAAVMAGDDIRGWTIGFRVLF
jgi:hypothetical protein